MNKKKTLQFSFALAVFAALAIGINALVQLGDRTYWFLLIVLISHIYVTINKFGRNTP